jgi:hypothetical protein
MMYLLLFVLLIAFLTTRKGIHKVYKVGRPVYVKTNQFNTIVYIIIAIIVIAHYA